ncbi:ABC transporter permease [Halovulum sp. GXIMD14794]
MRDSWKIFSVFCLVGALLLVVLPQVWIILSAFKQEGGAFTLRLTGGEMQVETADLERFSIEEDTGGRVVLGRADGFGLVFERIEPGLTLVSATDPLILTETAQGTRFRFNAGPAEFSVEQSVPMNIFGDQSPPVFETEQRGDAIALRHEPRGFMRFRDHVETFTLANFKEFLGRSTYLEAVKNSLIVTVVSTFLASVVAIPLAWLVSRYRFRGRAIVVALITMASVSPPFLGAYVWRMLFGSTGLLTTALGLDWSIVGIHGVIWVIMWLVYPMIFLMSLDSFTGVDPTLRESAMSLGAPPRRSFWGIEIPTCLPGIVTGLYMASMQAFSDFGTPFIISLDLVILPKLVYSEFLNETGGNVSIASTGSLIMLTIAMMFLGVQRLILAGKSFASVTSRKQVLQVPGRGMAAVIYGFAATVIGIAFTPHVVIVITSFLEWRVGAVTAVPTLQNYVELFTNQFGAVFVSLSAATTATFLCLTLGLSIAYVIVRKSTRFVTPLLNGVIMIPYIIPGTVFAIGFILAFNQPPILLTGTWFILVLSYFTRMLPFTVKTGESALYQIHPAMEDAALSLGARPTQAFRHVVAPMMLSGAVTGMTLVFLRSVTELSSTILLYRPPWTPMSAVIFQNTVSPGANFGYAAAMSVLMMVILYVPLTLITLKRKAMEQ